MTVCASMANEPLAGLTSAGIGINGRTVSACDAPATPARHSAMYRSALAREALEPRRFIRVPMASLERVTDDHAGRTRKLPRGRVVVHTVDRRGIADDGSRVVDLVDVDRALAVGDVGDPELEAEVVGLVELPVVRGGKVELPEERQTLVVT